LKLGLNIITIIIYHIIIYQKITMNTTIYLPDDLAEKLQQYTDTQEESRNFIIATAINEYLERKSKKWSKSVLEWQGDPEFEIERDNKPFDLNEEIL
jgi:predicted transcriptional regulator